MLRYLNHIFELAFKVILVTHVYNNLTTIADFNEWECKPPTYLTFQYLKHIKH